MKVKIPVNIILHIESEMYITCNARIAPNNTMMMELPADSMRRASIWSERVSTPTTGSATVLDDGTPTVR